jgi:hypothetical protein
VFRETVTCVEWESDAGLFRFERVGGTDISARLVTPDGVVTELSDPDWGALALAIARVVPSHKRPIQSKKMSAALARPNAGKPWDAAQDADLRRSWMAGESARSLSLRFGRSAGGIAARLVKLGLINERAEARLRSDESVAAPGADDAAHREQ